MAPIHGHLETFCLESLLNLENIQHSAHAISNDKHILALVTSEGDLVLYYISEDGYITLRRVPWFVEPDRKISALSFHPHGAWLLATSWDGSLHMVPAMALVDPGCQGDTRWNTLDLTTFPSVTSSTPSCLVWWQGNIEGSQVAIIGTVTGEIIMYDLISRERVGAVSICGPVDSLRLCHDSAITVMLLITNKARQQWKLLLESREAGFVWPLENRTGSKGDIGDPSSALSPTPPVRSRLQGLKQMSVEKIASIRQRLAERTRTISPQSPLTAAAVAASPQNNQSVVSVSKGSEGEISLPASSQNPEKWSTELFLWPQQCRSYHVLSGLHSPTCTLTLNSIVNMELVPVTTYRVPTGSSEVLVTNNFMFVVDASGSSLCVLSCKTAEARLDSLTEAMGPEALVDKFELKPGEIFLAFYLIPGPYEGENSSFQNSHRKSVNFGRRIPQPRNNTLRGVLQPSVEEELKTVKGFNVPSCIVVTSQSVYLLLLSEAVSRRVLDYLIRGCKIDFAEHLCSVFGLDMQKLLELAGDEQFNRGQYAAGGKLHQLAKSRKLKILLKFSSKGKASFLLTLISELLTSSFRHQDLSVVERVHLVKMLLLCYIKELLGAKRDDPITEKNFVKLLQDFRIYDQSLCTSLIGQVGFFKALHILCEYRSLAPECLESLTLTMEQIMNRSHKKGTLVRSCLLVTLPNFWDIASDFTLQEGIIQRPLLARTHFKFVLENLNNLSPNILKRLVALYDPTTSTFHPTARITLNDTKLGISRKYSDASAFSLYRRSGVTDGDSLDLMTIFLILLLKLCGSTSYKMALVDCSNGRYPTKDEANADTQHVNQNGSAIESPIPLKRRCLSAGTTHVVALRNCTVFSWGAGDSSLGLGPVARNVHLPQEVPSFSLGNICVASVACGRSHTIALTNHGVFAWGSSSRGQLGIPKCGQSPYPRRIPKLYSKEVVAVSAGQYHSIALTNSGTVLTWGWGVFGQLGHRSVEDVNEPTPVEALRGKPVIEAAGGHAHSVVLLRDGTVMTFGSSAFGQLGYGKTAKSTSPVVVPNLPVDVCCVSTGHFHCLALTSSNELYTWGLSPHVLKIQAQAKKKARAIQQLSHEPQQCQLPPRSQSFCNSPARAAGHQLSSCTPFSESQTYSLIDSEYRLPLQGRGQQEELPAKAVSNGADHPSIAQIPLQVPDVVLDATLAGTPATLTSSVEDDSKADVQEQNVGRGVLEEKTKHDMGCGPDTVSACVDKPTVQVEPHLLPSVVDTSGVEGHIKEIACGCHHSALLTDAGHVYTWGRNPEGQLGIIGIRDSVVPTRVKVLPEKFAGNESINDDAAKSTSNSHQHQQGSKGQEGDEDADTRFDSIVCGSECTFGVDSKGRIWGWGCNGHGQIGRLPSREPGRDLDAKTIKLPSSRRVIKIPMGLQDYSQLPVRVMGLPLCKEYKKLCAHAPEWPYWFFGNDVLRKCAVKLSPFSSLEEPAFGLRTLHHALRLLYPCYNVALVREKCLEVKNLQASANIALQEEKYALAVRHHLLALGEAADEEPEHSVTTADDETDADAAVNDAEQPYENGCDDVVEGEGEGIHAFAVQGGSEEMSEGTGSSTSTSSGSRSSLENDQLCSPKKVAASYSNNSWLAKQALRIAEMFITLVELTDRDALSGVLAECLQFWWARGLPVDLLEQFVKEHYDLLAYPLGNIMVLGKNGFTEDCSALFRSFTAKFHIDLCKTMTKRFSEEMSSEDRLKIVSAVIRQNPAWIDLRILAENPAPWDEDSPFIIQLGDGQCGDVTVFSCGHSVLPGDVATLMIEAQKGLSKEAAGILSHIVGNLPEGASQQHPLVKVEHACPTCIGRFLRLFDV